jgi:hypothetical protein
MMPPSRPSHRGPSLLAIVLLTLLLSFACSVDLPQSAYGVKSDEATYVSMALSLAHDGNLSFESSDYERFAAIYGSGPEGIFLKLGRQLRVSVRPPFPYVHLIERSDPATDRAYYGKSFAYSLFAAPFVRAAGLNGMLVFHALLLVGIGVCGYLFLVAQRASPASAVLFTTAFFCAAAVPVYSVFLMPEVFNVALVFFAYFLWLYKEVRRANVHPDELLPPPLGYSESRPLWAGRWTDLAAAVLLGIATYSKPFPNAFLVAPLVMLAWWRRRWLWGFTLGSTAVAVTVGFFAATAAISGEFNYQGGFDRRVFYGRFPFDSPERTWQSFVRAEGAVTTDGTAAMQVLTSPDAPEWFARNVKYFLVGRHFGLVPYYFPGVVAILTWLATRHRRESWRVMIFLTFVLASAGLLLLLPFTWSGGGGPPGNRYLLSAYPVLFFLIPPLGTALPALLAWIGGAMFTVKLLVMPFEAAKFTWTIAEEGPLRMLPVELTMAGDLPVMLTTAPVRGRVQYGHDPFVLMYFLDENAFPPEPEGMWVSADGRADIIVRAVDPIDHLEVEAWSPIATTLTLSMGAGETSIDLEPGKLERFDLPAIGIRGPGDHRYLLTAEASEGFVPRARDPASQDYRNLGAQLRFRPVSR